MATELMDRAKKAKADEFYTQMPDIEAELRHYKEHFRGKVVLCIYNEGPNYYGRDPKTDTA
ncbi:MAG: adenine-specific methyltransferase EcoRI family protein, partial [Anaerolineaceae bacterium]